MKMTYENLWHVQIFIRIFSGKRFNDTIVEGGVLGIVGQSVLRSFQSKVNQLGVGWVGGESAPALEGPTARISSESWRNTPGLDRYEGWGVYQNHPSFLLSSPPSQSNISVDLPSPNIILRRSTTEEPPNVP